ncbi:hypothetical protein MCOR27_002268 [Pyricularia oryzae]|uniref:Vacuolar import and degradation protein n=2 Tax=Pyricularia TaxID=48558 RepID=A0ABQ8NI30_PYRGI|nr:hypothetical protein MCOR01_006192 [Pyricularia oryzae]KAI6297481.1 hypothetical protein MCOR33_006211 [Pyricularia grisea]KAH9435506.1 hypothetical protein MCOR02_004435 [Pyricularia oryzae]KAI6258409.1 hypothetical protein MCOR19_005212 [Pyricularia oryzae]KAI6270853.1 hypothetical protein MCOR26_008067 [Pyricularia oryzae]
MPTPSNLHNPDSRAYPFSSTCPDDQTAVPTQPPSPSSWNPPLPSSYAERVVVTVSASDSDGPITSRPASRSDDDRASPNTDTGDDAHDNDDDVQNGMDPVDYESTRLDTDDELSPEQSGAATAQGGSSVPASSTSGISHATPSRSADEDVDMQHNWADGPSMSDSYFSQLRVIPTTPSSYLRPGSKFYGTQHSERQIYDVQVEIKHVDLAESFLCGYLRIQGLTEDHPTLTTYFEGEIIGPKYSFTTKHPSWGANEKTDLTHWSKFAAFRPFAKAARKGGAVIRDVAQREHIFMRWKEIFLVPDHRVLTINGASFEGFYYICFNQIRGDITGIYFHSKSERFQQLELKHVEDKGCFSAMEFR